MSCRAEVDSVRPVREEMSWETCAEMGRLTIVFRCAETAVGVLGRGDAPLLVWGWGATSLPSVLCCAVICSTHYALKHTIA